MIKKSVLKSFGQYNVPKMALALLVALIVGIVIYYVYRRFYTGVVYSRKHKPEILLTALYPVMHLLYPVWQKVLDTADINPAEAAWINEQMELAEQEGREWYDDTPTDEEWSEKHE